MSLGTFIFGHIMAIIPVSLPLLLPGLGTSPVLVFIIVSSAFTAYPTVFVFEVMEVRGKQNWVQKRDMIFKLGIYCYAPLLTVLCVLTFSQIVVDVLNQLSICLAEWFRVSIVGSNPLMTYLADIFVVYCYYNLQRWQQDLVYALYHEIHVDICILQAALRIAAKIVETSRSLRILSTSYPNSKDLSEKCESFCQTLNRLYS